MENLYKLFISPEVSVDFLLNSLLLVLFSIALYHVVLLLKESKNVPNIALEYSLERRAYLLSTIIKFSLYVYIFLLFFFLHLVDSLSAIMPGAMCGAGIIGGSIYGNGVMILKFVAIIASMLWLFLHKEDLRRKDFPFFRRKLQLFIALYALIVLNYIVEILFLKSLNFEEGVMCCFALYGSVEPRTFFSLDLGYSALALLALYIAILVTTYLQKRALLALFLLLFIPLSYYALTYFFSSYIYGDMEHKCPFCILHQKFYFIGYFIYGSFILALYSALKGLIFNLTPEIKRDIVIYFTLFMFFVSYKFVL